MISGFDPENMQNSDTGILLNAQGMEVTLQNCDRISPWRFADAISPNMAAENESREIHFPALVRFCRKNENTDYVLVEGAGGVMTPLGRNETMLDWIKELNYQVILVAGSYLGTVSHTLTAYQTLAAKKANLHSVIVSESDHSPVPVARTLLTLENFLPNNLATYGVSRNHPHEDLKHIQL